MTSLLTKEQVINSIKHLNKSPFFVDVHFFVYTDGEGWGFETFGRDSKGFDEAQTACNWWNYAMREAKHSEKYAEFGFTYINKKNTLRVESNPITEIERIEVF